MHVRDEVVIRREQLGGYSVIPYDRDTSGTKPPKASCTTLEEALEILSKLMEEQK